MIKSFLMKKMLERQLANVPKAQREMVMRAFEKDPDFFTRVAKEAEEKTKAGMDKTMAVQRAFMDNADEMRKLLGQ